MSNLHVRDGTWSSYMLSMCVCSVLHELRPIRPLYHCPADSGCELCVLNSGQKGNDPMKMYKDSQILSYAFPGSVDDGRAVCVRSLQKSILKTTKIRNNYEHFFETLSQQNCPYYCSKVIFRWIWFTVLMLCYTLYPIWRSPGHFHPVIPFAHRKA